MYINAKERYDWDRTAKKWENILDNMPLVDRSFAWNSPPKMLPSAAHKPENLEDMSSDDLVKWGILHVLRDPAKMNSFLHLDLARSLDSGTSITRNSDGRVGISPFGTKDLMTQLYNMREIKNIWEQERVTENRVQPEFCSRAKRGR